MDRDHLRLPIDLSISLKGMKQPRLNLLRQRKCDANLTKFLKIRPKSYSVFVFVDSIHKNPFRIRLTPLNSKYFFFHFTGAWVSFLKLNRRSNRRQDLESMQFGLPTSTISAEVVFVMDFPCENRYINASLDLRRLGILIWPFCNTNKPFPLDSRASLG